MGQWNSTEDYQNALETIKCAKEQIASVGFDDALLVALSGMGADVIKLSTILEPIKDKLPDGVAETMHSILVGLTYNMALAAEHKGVDLMRESEAGSA